MECIPNRNEFEKNINNKIDVVETIDVEELINDFKIINVTNLSAYMKEIWKDLSQRSDNIKLGVNKITFSNYFKLPGLIFERLFSVFDKNQNDYLDINEFLQGMLTLFSESFERLAKLVFNIYDFDRNGYVNREDVRVLLSYIPLKESEEFKSKSLIKKFKLTLEKSDYKDQNNSQDELNLLLEKTFKNFNDMDFNTYLYTVQNISSEIFLYILIFLLENRPFNKKTLDEFQNQGKYCTLFMDSKKKTNTPNLRSVEHKQFKVVIPNTNSLLSPSVMLQKSPFWNSKVVLKNNMNNVKNISTSLNTSNSNQNNLETKHINFLNKLGMGHSNHNGTLNANITSDPRNILNKYSQPQIVKNTVEDKFIDDYSNSAKCDDENEQMQTDENVNIKTIPIFRKHRNNLKNIGDNKSSSHKFAIDLKEYSNVPILPAVKYVGNSMVNSINKINNMKYLFDQDQVNLNKLKFTFNAITDELNEEDVDENNEVNYEGFLYKSSRKKKLKKRYYKLIDKDFYTFRNKTDSYHKGLHNLSGVYIQECQITQFNDYQFYTFSLKFTNKTRFYYSEQKKDFDEWINCIKKSTEYRDLNDYYDIKEDIGWGRFGLVKLGIYKEDGRKVAIKIMNKDNMLVTDLEQVKREIEILKISLHPNIIKILEIYENANYFYLIMEYCSGGDLFSYIQKKKFKLSEDKACYIVCKIATALYFLHSYGIAHRDLKPENILLSDETEEFNIKLVDFGLSKIIGPNETCTEPYGTLPYAAPEVLLELPYNMSVDMWSLGIITYLLLTGCLPFDDENEREIVRKTINDPTPFPPLLWNNISIEAKNFVTDVLQKNPSKRINIKLALEHPWLNKYVNIPGFTRRTSRALLKNSF